MNVRFNGSEKKITELVKKINNPSIPVYPLAKGKATFKTPSSRTLALPCFLNMEFSLLFLHFSFRWLGSSPETRILVWREKSWHRPVLTIQKKK